MRHLSTRTSSRDHLLKFALITDLHVEYSYTPGNSDDCGMFACCRPDSGSAKDSTQAAGKWGDKRCDLSPKVLDSMMGFIKKLVKPDFLFWGGDSAPHDLESQTKDGNIKTIRNVTS